MRPSELKVAHEALRRHCETSRFDFKSTADISPLEDAIGQDRAVQALSFGIDIPSSGYHIFALGAGGTGKATMVMSFLRQKAANQAVPDDWAYVNSFNDHDNPIILRFPAGIGRQVKADMRQLVDDLRLAISQVLESEDYHQAQERVLANLKKESEEGFKTLEQHAAEKGFKVLTMPNGIIFAPAHEGHVLSPEELNNLNAEARATMEAKLAELQNETREMMVHMRQLENETRERHMQLEQQTVHFATEALFDKLREKYAENAALLQHLERLQTDVYENLELFQDFEEDEDESPVKINVKQFAQERYLVNLVVDNSETQGVPVIFEDNPHYHNLIGRIEHEVHQGALITNFTMIKAGALMRANGGYLVMEAYSLLTKPFAWDALKTALKNNKISLGMMAEEHQILLTRSLQPEAIPLDVRVVLLGDPQIYYLLYHLNEDFRELFKVKADFASEMTWDDNAPLLYARFIAKICQTNHLKHFDPSAVALLIEESARSVEHQGKLATRFGDVVDMIQQSSYWANRNGGEFVTAEDVRRAYAEQRYRNNQVEERLQEMIQEETLLIATEGTAIGQINGLAVLSLGDYSFGKPSRITARTYLGNAGMVNIDREVELGGKIHNKGVLILQGYLGGKYAQKQPLVLSASITFEQVYEEVEGDSASSAELYALLSSLSNYPLRQDLAVTGSVNQHGYIQAIGGVNQKIEGFYDVCHLRGLTGTQGVIIPKSNVRHLMLREDVISAVRAGKFHIYAVSTVDEGLHLLTGLPAGDLQVRGKFPSGTVHRAVQDRLTEFMRKSKPQDHAKQHSS